MKRPLVLPAIVLSAIGSVSTSAQAPVLRLLPSPPALTPMEPPPSALPGDGRFTLPFHRARVAVALRGKFGARRGYGWHDGVDFALPIRTPIYAARSGVVERLEHFDASRSLGRGYGGFVVVRHEDGSHSWYAHLEKVLVRVGQSVNTRTRLGLSGGRNNGHSSGPHLHFSVFRPNGQALNPAIALEADKESASSL